MSEEQTDTTLTPYRTPWTIHSVGRKDGALTVCTGDGGPALGVAYVPNENDELTEGQQRLHARLIATAPKMKSQLRNLIHEASDAADILEGHGMTWAASDLRRCIRNAEQTIAEAKGRDE